jgi:hypothetical protein
MSGRGSSARPPVLDQHQLRLAWRRLSAAAMAMAQRAIDSDGREVLEADHFAHDLHRTGGLRFPVDGGLSAQGVSTAFVIVARAMLNAGYPRRRAIVAPALLATAKAVDELLTEQATRDADHWKRQMGEGGD